MAFFGSGNSKQSTKILFSANLGKFSPSKLYLDINAIKPTLHALFILFPTWQHSPTSAPSIAPGNVEVIRLNGTAMNVSWVPMNLVEAQGFVRGYIIAYQQASSGSQHKRQMQMVQVDGSTSYAIVRGLQPGVAYEVTVSGMTVQNGPSEFEW